MYTIVENWLDSILEQSIDNTWNFLFMMHQTKLVSERRRSVKLVDCNGDWSKLDVEYLNTTDTQFYETECENFTKMAYEYYCQTWKKTVTPFHA